MEKSELKGKLILIVGPSGVGKGTVIAGIKKLHPEFTYPISATTRKPREAEKEGEVYHFTSHAEFKEMIEKGELLEYAVVHNKEYYGTIKKPIIEALKQGETVLREVDMQGLLSIREIIPKKNLISIFLTVPKKSDLLDRIHHRGKLPDEEVARRMKSAEKEFALSRKVCDYRVISVTNKIKELVSDVESIILKEVGK